MQSAFDIADWSEEHFNNRALFADYYLRQRLPEDDVSNEDPKPAFRRFREIYDRGASRWAGKGEVELRVGLLEPALQALGFTAEAGKPAGDDRREPDYVLRAESGAAVAVCLAYCWGRFLDGKDDQRDTETPDGNPGAVIVSLLDRGDVPFATVTNGKPWRVYAAKAYSRATNYYEVDLEEMLALDDPDADAFRYFWLLFRARSMERAEVVVEGERRSTTFIDQILERSEAYAKRLGDRLKDRIFEEIFPHFAAGFIAHMRANPVGAGLRARPGQPQGVAPTGDLTQSDLDAVFHGTLTFLYRLLFLLYAEARDLLPVKEVRGFFEKSLTNMKREIGRATGDVTDAVTARVSKTYAASSYELYDRLADLFRIVDRGDAERNVPIYNGGLFLTEPDDGDATPEAENARFLLAHKIPDRHLALGLDLLARDDDEKTYKRVFIDYKSLGVRQLGSIYEGLLEFRLRIAPEKMAVCKGKKTEEVIPYAEAKKTGRKILTAGRGKDAAERILAKGAVYLENDKRERKATGSYYTPDYIVEYIVAHTVGPVLQERMDRARPALREAQKALRREREKAQELQRRYGKADDPEREASLKHHDVVETLFGIKVLDPAMGSGHFLVEAVDFITDRMLDFLNGFPWNPVVYQLRETRETILKELDDQGVTIDRSKLTDVNLLKRYVLKRCIYGGDINPMAVELAKVSLWLDSFTLGAPLSFLDHHLNCGNSLIGVTVEEVNKAIRTGQLSLLSGTRFEGMKQAVAGMVHVGELSDVTAAQVRESRQEFERATAAMAPAKRLLDVYTSQWFRTRGRNKKANDHNPALEFLRDASSERWAKDPNHAALTPQSRQVVETALTTAAEKRFFHWELEFPEVFYAPQPGTRQKIERQADAGFDAVIGNPPYDVLASEELDRDVSQELAFFEAIPLYTPAVRGKKNLYKLFICRGRESMEVMGRLGFIVPMALLGDDQATGVRRLLLDDTGVIAVEAFPQKDDPRRRVFPEAKLSTTIFIVQEAHTDQRFLVRTHPGRTIDSSSPSLRVRPSEIAGFDPENRVIPSCTQRDWDLAVTLLVGQSGAVRMRGVAVSFQGEVNETNERAAGALSESSRDPLALRGANVCLYVVREASQGEDVRVNVERFLRAKGRDTKAFAFEHERVGFQRSSPQNNFRRIIAARVMRGAFCLDTVSYVTDASSKINLDLLLALLNSKILDWYFRLGSTNSKVNEYQFNALPVPRIASGKGNIPWQELIEAANWRELTAHLCDACTEPGIMPARVAEALAEMSRRIQGIEVRRVLKSRTQRSSLASESQPIQDAIDAVLFRCYGLSDDDAEYVSKRLEEML